MQSPQPADGPSRLKRKRQTLSCAQCVARKVKCDRKRPCTNCFSRPVPLECSLDSAGEAWPAEPSEEPAGSEAQRNVPWAPHALHARLSRLEKMLLGGSTKELNSLAKLERSAARTSLSPEATASRADSETEDALMALEDMAAGVRNARIKTRAGQPDMIHFPTAHSPSDTLQAGPVAMECEASNAHRGARKVQVSILSPTELSVGGRVTLNSTLLMPPMARRVCCRLTRLYFEKVAWSWPVLYEQHFMAQVEVFEGASGSDMRHKVDPLWLSVLCSVGPRSLRQSSTYSLVLAVAIVATDALPAEYADVFSHEEWVTLPAELHEAAKELMSAGQWTMRPCVRAVQTVALFGPYLLFSGLPRAVEILSIYVAAGVRLVQALGWHKRSPDLDAALMEDIALHGNITSRRQAVSRLVYAILTLDQVIYRFQPVLPIPLVTCPLPGNMDDHMAAAGQVRDNDVFTDATLEILRFEIARLCRKFNDEVVQNQAFRYEYLLDIERQFRALVDEYDLETPTPGETIRQTWARLQSCQQIHMRLMRVHRPYMSTGYRDSRYLQSTRTAFDSAKILLQNERILSEAGALVTRGCFQVVHIQTAIVVICLDAWQCVTTGDSTQYHATLVRDTLDLLRPLVRSCREQVRRVARQTCLIAGTLLEALHRRESGEEEGVEYAALLRRIADLVRRIEHTEEATTLVEQFLAGASPAFLPKQDTSDDILAGLFAEIENSADGWLFPENPDTDYFAGFMFPSST